MKRKQKSASRRRGEILPIDSYSLMGDPSSSDDACPPFSRELV